MLRNAFPTDGTANYILIRLSKQISIPLYQFIHFLEHETRCVGYTNKNCLNSCHFQRFCDFNKNAPSTHQPAHPGDAALSGELGEQRHTNFLLQKQKPPTQCWRLSTQLSQKTERKRSACHKMVP